MKFVPDVLHRTVSRQILVTRKHAPAILFVGGVAGVIGTTVLACRATLHLEEVIDDAQKKLELSKKFQESHELQHSSYTDEKAQEDVRTIYIQAVFKITKLYGPPVLLGILSIAALTGSHRILTKRNAGLSAAYALVDMAFKDYRRRVIDELGEEKDREFRYGTEENTLMLEDTNGPKAKKVTTWGDGGGSMYSKIFDEFNQNWDPHLEYNVVFLRGAQNQANDQLKADGHLFLNDVYRDLGFDDTSAGAVTGWIYKKHGEIDGDGYVDFGIFDDRNMLKMHDFIMGREGGILLDFNVDGPIWDQI